MQNCKKHFN